MSLALSTAAVLIATSAFAQNEHQSPQCIISFGGSHPKVETSVLFNPEANNRVQRSLTLSGLVDCRTPDNLPANFIEASIKITVNETDASAWLPNFPSYARMTKELNRTVDDCKQLALLAQNNPGRFSLFVAMENGYMSVSNGGAVAVELVPSAISSNSVMRCALADANA